MAFQSLSFLAFFTLCVLSCRGLEARRRGSGAWALLAFCAVFCLWGLPDRQVLGGFLVLLGGAVVTRTAAAMCAGRPGRGAAVLAALWLVGVLAFHKYASGWLPLGLSFFTFQQLWYLKEVCAGQAKTEPWRDYLLYSFFFPTVTSGPILRPGVFFPQLRGEGFLRPDAQDAAAGLSVLWIGAAKKVLLADPLGTVVNAGWGSLDQLSAPAAWLVILGYTLQLYFDFSGYCDMATGAARLLGIRLPVNFNSPYRAISVGDFWRRWHRTLTAFLRECVYFPLGGSRNGTVRTCRNILIVYLISGLWHGTGWTFVVWGLLHGAAQVAERLAGQRMERLPKSLRWLGTFAFVNLAWVFFRAPDLDAAVRLLGRAVTGGLALPQPWLTADLFPKETEALRLLCPVLAETLPAAAVYGVGVVCALWPRNAVGEMDRFRPTAARAVGLALLAGWTVLSFSSIVTFIYSNF